MEYNHPIIEFLDQLPSNVFAKLYNDPCACLFIFRCCLSSNCKTLVLRLLTLSDPVPLSLTKKWLPINEEFNIHLWRLKQWNILQGKEHVVWISPEFKSSLLSILSSFNDNRSDAFSSFLESKDQVLSPSSYELNHYQKVTWERFLGLLVKVDTKSDIETIVSNQKMIELALASGLVKLEDAESQLQENDRDDEKVKIRKTSKRAIVTHRISSNTLITHHGFQFLLLPKHTQLWILIVQYLNQVKDMDISLVTENLSLLFKLSFVSQDYESQIVKGYDMISMTTNQQSILKNILSGLGLVFIQKDKSKTLFYPTLSVKCLLRYTESTDIDNVGSLNTQSLSLIIESNYHVYAYTDSDLNVAILSLFIKIQERFTNFITGMLDHESCQSAFRNGITSDQIITFLTNQAHPNMRQDAISNHRSTILPSTLIDQIKLWELEQHRVSIQPACLYHQFAHTPDYERALQYANQIQCVLLAIPEKRLLVTTIEGHENLHKWFKQS